MATNKLLWVSLLLIQAFRSTECGASYQGCFVEDRRSRLFTINPGDYDPLLTTPDLCASKCGAYGFPYAALTYGRFCFCGSTAPTVPAVPNSNCQELCSGDSLRKCGGKGHVSLFTSSQPITGLVLSSDATSSGVTVGTPVTFDFSVTSGNEVYYQMDYDDGAGLSWKNATGMQTRTYHVPGTYSVRVEANDFNDTLAVQKAVTTVVVKAPVADVDIECQEMFATYDEGWCKATVWQGTDLSFTATIALASVTYTFPSIADPVLTRVGPGVPAKGEFPGDLLDPGHSGTVVALASLVENPGRVVGWELSVKTVGTFKVLILAPDCGGNQYCPLDNTCQASCAGDAGVYSVSCSGNTFCPRKRLCDDATCAAPERFHATTPKVATYTVKAVVDVTASGTGYQYVAETGLVEVAAGDVLGLDIASSGGAALYSLDCPPTQTDFSKAGASAFGATITTSGLTPTGGDCLALRAVVSEGSEVYLPFTFSNEGNFTLDVTASDTDGSSPDASNSTQIEVFEGVNFTIISGPSYVKVGVPETFSVEPHTGRGALYTWDDGTGTVDTNTTFQSKSLTYAAKGTYNLTVTTVNAVSSKTNSTVVIAQVAVTGLNVTGATAAASGETHTFQFTLATGSDYTCEWTLGDGTETTTDEVTTPAGATTGFDHIYNTIGDKTVTVNCSNDVSWDSITLTQKVQERITNLRLSRLGQDSGDPVIIPWEVDTGSDIVWSTAEMNAGSGAIPLTVNPADSSGHKWNSDNKGVLAGGTTLTISLTATNDINSDTFSGQYVITTAIQGFSAMASTDNTTSGKPITYTVSWSVGSDVNVTLVYTDGNVDSQVYGGDWPSGNTVTFTHAFQDGGTFDVQVSASNAAGTFSDSLYVLVRQGVNDIMMFCPDFSLYSPPSFIDVWFEMPSGKASPTDPKLELDYDNVYDPMSYELELNKNYTGQYNEMGSYDIRATVSNVVDSKIFNCPVVIMDALEGPKITTEFPKAPRGQPLNVTFSLYRGPQAPYCNLTWNFQGGETDQVTGRNGRGQDGQDTTQVTYKSVGTNTITVTASSPLQTVSASITIDVIEAVVESSLSITVDSATSIWTYPGPVKVNIIWTSADIPYSPSVDIQWGDGALETNLPFPVASNGDSKNFQHTFTTDGLMQTTVTVYNDASSVVKVLDMGVYKDFTGMTVTKYYTPDLPVGAAPKTGLDGSGNLFSNDQPVQFTISTSNNAKASYYEVTAVHDTTSETVVCNKTDNPFFVALNSSGAWTVSVRAVNPLYSKTVNTPVIITEKVVGLEISHNPDEKNAGVPKNFYIQFITQGTDTCLTVEFGDGSRAMYADDVSYCKNAAAQFQSLPASGMLTGTTSMAHTYLVEKSYVVTMIAQNQYSSITKQLSFDITGLDCSQPQVSIHNASTIFTSPNYYRRGDIINFNGIPRIACSVFENQKIWSIETIDPAWGNVTGVVTLPADVVITTAALRLPRWTLDYGLYRVAFNMSMGSDPEVTFTATAYSYFKVVRSDLVGLMVDGGTSEIVRGTESGNLKLTPLAYSYDPDVVDRSPLNSGLSVVNWTCTYQNGTSASACTNLLAAASNGSSGSLTYSMKNLLAGETYTITVWLEKAEGKGSVTRDVQAAVHIAVVSGDPPQVTIKCTAGSVCYQLADGYLVLESDRLSLTAECSNCGTNEVLGYNWTIFIDDYRWALYGGWRPLEPIELEKYQTVGPTSKAISLQPALFKHYKENHKLYKAKCSVNRNGVEGWAATLVKLNEPPKGGRCTIIPKEMAVTMDKLFHIECTDWTDTDTGISKFEFYSYFDPESTEAQITSVETNQGFVSLNVSLDMGAHYLDYNNTVRVRVRDTMGAATEIDIDTVRVTPVDPAEVRKMTADLRNNPTSDLEKMFQQGDPKTVTEFITTVSAMLNSDSKTSQTEYQGMAITSTKSATAFGGYDSGRVDPYTAATVEVTDEKEEKIESERDDRAQVRALILESITKIPANTMLVRKQIMSAMDKVLLYPDEVTGSAQMTVTNTLDNFASMLDDGEEVTPEDREENMKYLVACIGSVLDATGTGGFAGTLTELLEAAEDELYSDYPTENVAEDDECLRENPEAYTLEDAAKRQQKLTHCRLTRANSTRMAALATKVMSKLRNSFMFNSIEGESKQFDTARMRTKFVKSSVKNMLSGPQTLEHSTASLHLPADLSSIFPTGTVGENDTVTAQMSEATNNPLRYGKTAKSIPTTTRFVTFDLYDHDGRAYPLKNMVQPLMVTIPRAGDLPPLDNKYVNPKLVPWNKFQLHKTELNIAGASIHAVLCPVRTDVQYVVVINLGAVPDPEQGLCNKSFLVPANMSDPNRPACTTVYMDNEEVNNYVGTVYFGVRQLTADEMDMDVSNCTELPAWSNGTTASEFTGNYTIKMFGSGCFAISENDTDWSTQGCRVHESTNESATVCECNHLTTFAGGWVVVPNTIDWNYVFNNFDFYKNPTLYVTECVILIVYIIAVIWARHKDKKDLQLLGIAPLLDNDPKDKYYYEIVVVTGMRRNAGTDSRVFFILSGEDDETDVREFSDSKRKIFRRGHTNGFLMATPRPLGYLNYARIWHDNSGKGNMGSWYLNYMIVRDVQTDEKWVFIADRWFAVEEDDGQVDRIVPVATREAMTQFGYLFAERSRKNLADGHLWFSVVARPPQSRFTCVQRVSCCLCLLAASMLANAMFYRTEKDTAGTTNGITLGPFSVSLEQISIGIMSNLIVFPVNFIIITLFRKARPRKLRPSRVDEAIKTAHDGPRTEASVNDVKPEVSSIFSISRPASMIADPKPRPESSLSRPGTSLSTRADATLPTKKKKKSLPWWCRIVAWVLLWLATLVSMAFVTFYGISFADETCKKWISSMLISFFMSVFVTQPIKVFLLAIFLSLIIKNPGEDDEEEEELDEERTKLANDEIPLHDMNPESYGAARPRKIGYKPPDRSLLEAARQQRLKEIQMWSIVREVVIYSIFLWILLLITFRQRNGDTFLYKHTMERVYIKNNETDIDFEKIRNVNEYWNWTRSGLVNGIRAGPYYNDLPPFLLRGYVNDKVSKILGYATMRQLRIKPSLCELDERMMELIRECNIMYDILKQEEGSFDVGWKPKTENSTGNDTSDWYSYTKAKDLDGYPYWGQLALYAGGGYVVPLKGSKTDLIALMNELERNQWIDRYTRAVFVEFTTYNAQVNLFGIAYILAEFHPTGGVVQSYRFEPALLLPYMTQAMLFQLVCEGFYCFFILFFIIRLLRVLIKQKLSFFKDFWNLVEMGIIAMSLGAIVIYFYRMFETKKLTKRFKESNGMDYIKFQYVGYWNEIFTYMMGWTVFFATLKFMRLLRFNKRMSLLAATLKNGARSLLHFSIIFWIVFLAFSMLFFLSFMTIDIKYSSFMGSVVSGILMMMGKFDIYAMTMAEPILTQVFIFFFVVSVTFVIVNMFVSILNETFGAVRADINKQSNDYEIIDFMISRFRRFTGFGAQQHTTLTPEELRNQEQERRYAEGMTSSCVDDFPDRIDRLLHSISNVYMDQETMTAMLDKRGYQRGAGPGAGARGGYDNMGFTGPKGRASELSKVHTH